MFDQKKKQGKEIKNTNYLINKNVNNTMWFIFSVEVMFRVSYVNQVGSKLAVSHEHKD